MSENARSVSWSVGLWVSDFSGSGYYIDLASIDGFCRDKIISCSESKIVLVSSIAVFLSCSQTYRKTIQGLHAMTRIGMFSFKSHQLPNRSRNVEVELFQKALGKADQYHDDVRRSVMVTLSH